MTTTDSTYDVSVNDRAPEPALSSGIASSLEAMNSGAACRPSIAMSRVRRV
jgi:hypothetical protein